MNIIQAMTDPNLFGNHFGKASYFNWRQLISGFYGLEVEDPEIFEQITKRKPPKHELSEMVMVVGRRGSKSHVSALLACYEAFFRNYQDRLSPGEVATIAVIATDRMQARSVMRYINGMIDDCPMLRQMVVRETAESIELSNRCVIEIRTATHRGVRGYTCAAVICDEIAFWLQDGANPDFEVINAVRPSLASLSGKLILLSSPNSRKGVLWEMYRKFYGVDDERVLVCQASTEMMNPTIDKEFIKRQYDDDPQSASAEFGAQFRTDIETFVSREILDICTIPDRHELPPCARLNYHAFVDVSGGSSDAYTLAIAHGEGKSWQEITAVIDCIRVFKPPFSPEQVTEEVVNLCRMYRIREVVGDHYAAELTRELYTKRNMAYRFSEKNKTELYREMIPILNSHRVELLDNRQLYNELAQLERKVSRNGREVIDHPPRQHDDAANAAAGVINLVLDNPRPGKAVPFRF